MLTLGQKLKIARKERGLTQAELVGDRITRNQLSLIENGINNPSLPTLEYLAERLDKPVSYFLSDEDFLEDEYKSLISKCETWNQQNEYNMTIDNITNLIENMELSENSPHKNLLGKLYTLLGECYFMLNRESAEEVLHNARNLLSNNTDETAYLCKTLQLLGIIHLNKNSYTSAENYLEQANNLLTNIALDNIILKLNIVFFLARTYTVTHKYDKLINTILEILNYSQKYKIYHNYGELKMFLSLAYQNKKNYTEAIQCITKAIEYFTFTEDFNNMNKCYINLSIIYRIVKKYEDSLKYIDMALNFFKNANSSNTYINAKAEKIKTLFYFIEDLNNLHEPISEIFDSIDNEKNNKPDLLTILGTICLENKDVDDALKLFSSAEELYKNIEDTEFSIYCYHALSILYKQQGEWEKAYIYLTKVNESKFELIRKFKL